MSRCRARPRRCATCGRRRRLRWSGCSVPRSVSTPSRRCRRRAPRQSGPCHTSRSLPPRQSSRRRIRCAWPSSARRAPTATARWRRRRLQAEWSRGTSRCRTWSTGAPAWTRSAESSSWEASRTPTRSTLPRAGPAPSASTSACSTSFASSMRVKTPGRWAFAMAASSWRCWDGCPRRRASRCPTCASLALCTTRPGALSRAGPWCRSKRAAPPFCSRAWRAPRSACGRRMARARCCSRTRRSRRTS
mmetsp:Transcript_42935/g.128889  ORF Transcript_42935/g.128889 Transcript_42935/m.128889 type:complete len:247 (-) Transcript_42935:978-1718(-)